MCLTFLGFRVIYILNVNIVVDQRVYGNSTTTNHLWHIIHHLWQIRALRRIKDPLSRRTLYRTPHIISDKATANTH